MRFVSVFIFQAPTVPAFEPNSTLISRRCRNLLLSRLPKHFLDLMRPRRSEEVEGSESRRFSLCFPFLSNLSSPLARRIKEHQLIHTCFGLFFVAEPEPRRNPWRLPNFTSSRTEWRSERLRRRLKDSETRRLEWV